MPRHLAVQFRLALLIVKLDAFESECISSRLGLGPSFSGSPDFAQSFEPLYRAALAAKGRDPAIDRAGAKDLEPIYMPRSQKGRGDWLHLQACFAKAPKHFHTHNLRRRAPLIRRRPSD